MTGLDECNRIFEEISGTSLRFRPKTKVPIQLLRTAMERAEGLPAAEFEALRESITQGLSFKLMYLGTLAAEEAVNARDASWLRITLLVHVLENFKFDFRENFLRLYAAEYAAWRLSANIADIVSTLDPMMTPHARELFANVFNEPHGQAALQLAHLSVIDADGEMRFAPAPDPFRRRGPAA